MEHEYSPPKRPISDETRAKLSRVNKGKVMSAEQKAKIAESVRLSWAYRRKHGFKPLKTAEV